MMLKLLRAKIHHGRVTSTDENYHGSITIDADLLRATGLLPNEAVLVADCENGQRFETYVIVGEPGSGTIAVNGAAAKLTGVGHRLIVMSFCHVDASEAPDHVSAVALVDRANRLSELIRQPTSLGELVG